MRFAEREKGMGSGATIGGWCALQGWGFKSGRNDVGVFLFFYSFFKGAIWHARRGRFCRLMGYDFPDNVEVRAAQEPRGHGGAYRPKAFHHGDGAGYLGFANGTDGDDQRNPAFFPRAFSERRRSPTRSQVEPRLRPRFAGKKKHLSG